MVKGAYTDKGQEGGGRNGEEREEGTGYTYHHIPADEDEGTSSNQSLEYLKHFHWSKYTM